MAEFDLFEEYRVLVVDDTPANIALLVDLLESKGCEMAVATSGEQALDIVNDFKPQLILLDVLMPGIDGFETCERIKHIPAFKNTPVIFITALSSQEDFVRALNAGGEDYVQKPVRNEELLARVRAQYAKHKLNLQTEELIHMLRQHAEFSNAIIHNTSGGIITLNCQGCITSINKAGADMIKAEDIKLLGQCLFDFLDGDKSIEGMLGNGHFELNLLTKDGEKREVDFAIDELHHGLHAYIAFMHDITHHKAIQRQLAEEKLKVEEYNEHLLQEQIVAKRIFDKIVRPGELGDHSIDTILSPSSVFNGDVLLVDTTPQNKMHMILGDFTGHGLSAAIGVMPLAEIFYTMTGKDLPLSEIIAEINSKLCRLLPTGVFCAAFLLCYDKNTGTVEAWNGGIPTALILDDNNQITGKIDSTNLALGIIDGSSFKSDLETYHLHENEKILLATDGLVEAERSDGEQFGHDRLLEVIKNSQDAKVFDEVVNAVKRFSDQGQADDLTVACLYR